jgi:hypothetical protein
MRFKTFALSRFVTKIFFLNKFSIIAKHSSYANNDNIIVILLFKFYLLEYCERELLKKLKKRKKLLTKTL